MAIGIIIGFAGIIILDIVVRSALFVSRVQMNANEIKTRESILNDFATVINTEFVTLNTILESVSTYMKGSQDAFTSLERVIRDQWKKPETQGSIPEVIHILEYSRDVLAKDTKHKEAFDTIINKLKRQNAKSDRLAIRPNAR
jgi:hypothetical protein